MFCIDRKKKQNGATKTTENSIKSKSDKNMHTYESVRIRVFGYQLAKRREDDKIKMFIEGNNSESKKHLKN